MSPTGGPKDMDPPLVITCDPPNLTTNFREKSFSIDFNEFVNLKSPATEVFISPPLKSPLDSRLKGKSIVIRFDDDLAPNTTYSITFGNSIVDLTEGNVLKGFNYVFSTGDYVDSLSLQGSLQTAFDHKPKKDVFIELYINNNDTIPFDSLPMKIAPYYITKTDEAGNFIFHNLQNKQFKLFALADQNGDLIFNQPSEKIAFCDSLATPSYFQASKPDSTRKDTTLINLQNFPSYSLSLFEETDSIQRLQNSKFPKTGMALLVFRFPVKNLRIVPLNFDSIAPWHIEEISKQRDSVLLWIVRPNTDSLIAKIMVDNMLLDTVRLEMTKKENLKPSEKKENQEKLGMMISTSGLGFNQYKNKLGVTFSYPLIQWDFKRVLLITDKDTINPEIKFSDSLKRKIIILHQWQENTNYKILIPDSVFFGILNITHDSVRMDFKTKEERDFGNLIVSMNMEKRPGQYIVQLLNEKESILYEEHIITGSGKIQFNFMPPMKYKLKAIYDRNRNQRWDTGNYGLNIQPEEVFYLPKEIEIRANWDVEETWN
ncbi:MAG: Ig-like domain-containing protein [Bacteroidetes bacterium]|nr:Ig-like domain-containing protein [Bacteroidota bacterium]